MLVAKLARIVVTAALMTTPISCGKKSSDADDKRPDAEKQSGEVLRMNAGELKLSFPHEVSAFPSGNNKVEAQFYFMSDAAYELRIDRHSQKFVDCDDAQPQSNFGWKEATGSQPVPVKLGEVFTAEKGKSYVFSVEADNVTTCGEMHLKFTVAGTRKGDSSALPATPGSNASDVDFKHHAVLREFTSSDSDKGALFIIKPSNNGALAIKEVIGPRFLGEGRSAVIDETSIGKLFTNSATPFSEMRRRQILEKYRGATALYFEGYSGRLCSGAEWTVQVSSTLNGMELQSDFTIVAHPSPTDDCLVQVASMTTKFFSVTSR